jgi:hypothetical protein
VDTERLMADIRAYMVCPDCGAPVDPERGVYSCVPESGSGVTVISEEQMATGEQVALTRRVYLDESKTAAIPAEAEERETREGETAAPPAEAAWLLGPPGAVMSKAKALALGLKEGADFGEVPDPRIAIAQQEISNRATMRRSEAAVLLPGPISTETDPERNAFDRETGKPLEADTPSLGEQETAERAEVELPEQDKPAVGGASPMPQRGGGSPQQTAGTNAPKPNPPRS